MWNYIFRSKNKKKWCVTYPKKGPISYFQGVRAFNVKSSPQRYDYFVRTVVVEFFTAVVMKVEVIWDVTPSRLANSYRRFE